MVWTCPEERPGVRRKKGDGNGVTGKEEKREAKEKLFGCSEGRYGESWCRRRTLKQDALEKYHTLWLPLSKGKAERRKRRRPVFKQIATDLKYRLVHSTQSKNHFFFYNSV